MALLTGDGRVLEWWTDIERTDRIVRAFQPPRCADAAALARRVRTDRRAHPRAGGAIAAAAPGRAQALLARSRAGRRLLEVSALSPLEFVEQEFEHPTIKAGLLFFNGLREVDLRARGFGHHIAALLASPAKAQMSRGGSAALARALEAAVRESGGDLRLMTEPKRILIEGGRAVGIETTEGERIMARRFVASSLNPQQTFLDLIDRSLLPGELRDLAQRFQYNLLAPLFALNLNLREPPHYPASAAHPQLARAFMLIMGLDHVDQFGEIVRHHEAGTVPPTVMWGACPTVFDPTQAPAGRHTAFMWEKLPYRLDGDPDNWDRAARGARQSHARPVAQACPQPRGCGDRLVHALAA